MNAQARPEFRLTALAAALIAVFGAPAFGAEDEQDLNELTKPQSEVRLGAGYVDADNQKFGEFSGLRDEGAYLLLDADVARRDDPSGTWLKLRGRNLGLESRSLRFEHERQGNWGYFLEYDAIPRFAPYRYNTGLAGIGTTSQIIGTTATPRSDVELSTKRKNVSAGFQKLLGRGLDVRVRFRNEEKDGSRAYGVYSPLAFLAEPIDWTTREWEATLGYTTDRFQVTGGYLGSSFDNANRRLDVAGAAVPPYMWLPPSNEAHQLHASGGFNFTSTTRGTFKVAYARATQDERFGADVAPLSGQTSLDGRVDTTLVNVAVVTRPLAKLSLLADLRYEDRDDRTPQTQYLPFSATSPQRNGFNNPRSFESTKGKLEASYLLPAATRLTAGVERDERKRTVPEARSVPYRAQTEDTAYRVDLRRSLGETLNGAVALVHEERTGSDPARDTYLAGTAGSNVVMPLHWNDRERDKVRLSLDWAATERLSVQGVFEDGKDKYRSFDTFLEGLHSADSRFYSLDATYAISEASQVSAWISRSEIESHQVTFSTTTSVPLGITPGLWAAGLETLGDSYGFGVRAKPMARVQLGADLVQSYDRDKFDMSRLTGTGAVTSLPNLYYKLTSLKLFAKYAVRRNYGVRVDYVHERRSTDDWTWQNWVYPDGTTVIQDPKQKVNLLGLSGYYQF